MVTPPSNWRRRHDSQIQHTYIVVVTVVLSQLTRLSNTLLQPSSLHFRFGKTDAKGKLTSKPTLCFLKSHTETDVDTLSIHGNLTAQSRPSARCARIVWLNFIDSNGHKTNRRFTVPFILKQTKSSSIIYRIFCTLCIYVCLFVSFFNNLCFVQSHFTLYYVYIFVISVKEEIKSIF